VNHRTTEPPNHRTSLSPAWRSLGIAALTLTAQNGIFSVFPVLYVALLDEFPWGRAEAAGIQSTAVLLLGLATPATGLMLDRFGPQRLFPLAALVIALGLAGASQGQALWHLYVAYGVLAALGHSALASTPNMVVVSKWFGAAPGRAIALADLGTGLGSVLIVPATQVLISRIGWRGALLALAGLLAAILVPLNCWQRFPPEPAPRPGRPDAGGRAWTVARAIRTVPFWALAATRFVSGLAFHMVNVHTVAFLVGLGYTRLSAASALGAISVVSMAGRVLVGVASDRLGPELALTLASGSTAAGILMLLALGSIGGPAFLVLAIAFYGLGKGSSGIVTIARAAERFPGSQLATIAGLITVASGAGEAVGTWFGGFAYDWTGSYTLAFLVALVALAVGVAAMWATGLTAEGDSA
jgi:MFS family permease